MYCTVLVVPLTPPQKISGKDRKRGFHKTISALKNKALPINGLQLSKIAIEAEKPSCDVYKWDADLTKVWNILNFGTEGIKVQNGSDSTSSLRANINGVNTVDEFFCQN